MGASNIGGPVAGTPSLGRLVGSIAVPTEIPQTIAIVARRRPLRDWQIEARPLTRIHRWTGLIRLSGHANRCPSELG